MPATITFQRLHILVDVQVDLERLEILLELVCTRPFVGAASRWLLDDLRACDVDSVVSAGLAVGLVAAGIWLLVLTHGLISSSKRLVGHFWACVRIRRMELLRRGVPLKRQFCPPKVYGRGLAKAASGSWILSFTNILQLR